METAPILRQDNAKIWQDMQAGFPNPESWADFAGATAQAEHFGGQATMSFEQNGAGVLMVAVKAFRWRLRFSVETAEVSSTQTRICRARNNIVLHAIVNCSCAI